MGCLVQVQLLSLYFFLSFFLSFFRSFFVQKDDVDLFILYIFFELIDLYPTKSHTLQTSKQTNRQRKKRKGKRGYFFGCVSACQERPLPLVLLILCSRPSPSMHILTWCRPWKCFSILFKSISFLLDFEFREWTMQSRGSGRAFWF